MTGSSRQHPCRPRLVEAGTEVATGRTQLTALHRGLLEGRGPASGGPLLAFDLRARPWHSGLGAADVVAGTDHSSFCAAQRVFVAPSPMTLFSRREVSLGLGQLAARVVQLILALVQFTFCPAQRRHCDQAAAPLRRRADPPPP